MHRAILMILFDDDIMTKIGEQVAKWASTIFSFIFLAIDGITYSILAYSYKLFELMARLNFSSLLTWFSPIMQRIQSLILVVILFVLGYSLILYLINPDKVQDNKVGGVALIKNIAIASVLLIIYKSVFISISDATFLLIGAPEGYQYNTEEGIGAIFKLENDGSPGLISNLIFGSSDSAEEEQVDFGTLFPIKVLNIFLYDKGSAGTILDETFRNAIEGKNYNLMPIVGAAYNINYFNENDPEATVEYKFPIISTLVGLYLIYTLVTIAIELGVRAFKLVILEILAPVAIITIIYGGWSAKIWKNWLSVFGKTFADIFMRVSIMYFVVAFIDTAWGRIGELFSYDEFAMSGFTSFLLTVLIVISGFKLAKELPKFIDSILGSKLAENNKSGFSSFLGGLAGGIAGVATGVGTGLASKAGLLGTAWNAAKGGVSGVQSGAKGKSIAESFKNIGANNKANFDRAQAIGRQGGGLRYLGNNISTGLGIPQRNQAQINNLKDTNTAIDNVMSAQAEEIKNKMGSSGIKFGTDADAYAQSYAQRATAGAQANVAAAQQNLNPKYQAMLAELADGVTIDDFDRARDELVRVNAANSGATAQEQADALDAYNKTLKSGANTSVVADYAAARDNYETAQASYVAAYDSSVAAGKSEWTAAADRASGDAVKAAKKEYRVKAGMTADTSRSSLKAKKDSNNAAIARISGRGSVRAANRQGSSK